jgi:hypothetical protein
VVLTWVELWGIRTPDLLRDMSPRQVPVRAALALNRPNAGYASAGWLQLALPGLVLPLNAPLEVIRRPRFSSDQARVGGADYGFEP